MSATQTEQRRTAYFSGMVQGVGFRYASQRVARAHPVSGFVRNLPDGRVELIAEGMPAALDAFVLAIDLAMKGYIDHVEIEDGPATGEFAGFEIRY